MQLDRIACQYPDGTTLAYDFHPRLTVIDVAPAHRRELAEYLLESLWTDAAGIHVEFTGSDAKSFVAFRPFGGAHRVIGIDHRTDATDSYAHHGHLNLLAPMGLSAAPARQLLLLERDDLLLADPNVRWTSQLIGTEIAPLLAAAEEFARAESLLAASEPQARPETMQRVSEAYEQRDTTTDLELRQNRVRLATLAAGTAGPFAAVAFLRAIGTWPALCIVAGCMVAALACIGYERRLAQAIDAEYHALKVAGVDSYDGLALPGQPAIAETESRTPIAGALEGFHHASKKWRELAGDIPAAWVLARRERLLAAAEIVAMPSPIATSLGPPRPNGGSDFLAGLMARIHDLTEAGSGFSLPLFLDDPTAGLSNADTTFVLNALSRLATNQQLVIFTNAEEILDWAAQEALADRASIVGANPVRLVTNAAPSRRPGEPGALER